MTKYCFVDVETANPCRASICQLGIICTNDKETTYERSFLINPECDFSPTCIAIHGITPIMALDAPTFPQVWREIKPYIDGGIIVAHNAASMELNAFSQSLLRYNMPLETFRYLDTRDLAKCALPNIGRYTLDSVCDALGIRLDNHHDALADARACKDIFFTLLESDQNATVNSSVFFYGDQGSKSNTRAHGRVSIAEYTGAPTDAESDSRFRAIYDALLSRHPDVAEMFPVYSALKTGASIYCYRQRVATLGALKTMGEYVEIPTDDAADHDLTKFKSISSNKSYTRIFPESDDERDYLIDMLYKIASDNFFSANVEQFGCCNSFRECSKRMKCVHADNWEYVGCEYRRNLAKGKCFY